MKKIKLFIVFLIALTIGLSSCSGLNIGGQLGDVGNELGDIKDQIGDHLGDNADVVKESLIVAVDEVLTKEGFKKCYQNLKDYEFSKVKDWDAEIGSVVDLLYLLHSVRNDEVVFADFIEHYENIRKNTVFVNDVLIKCSSEIIPLLPVVKNYYDENVEILNWENELDACVESLEALYYNDIRSLDDILSKDSKLTGSMMMIFTKSEFIKSFMVKQFNSMIADIGVVHIKITKEDFEQIETAENWDLEIEALHDLINFAEHTENLEFGEIVNIYNEIKVTILCKKILLDAAPELANTLPVVSNYYNDSVEIESWENELDAIIATLEALSEANATAFTNPLEEDSPLNGKVLNAASKSTILTKAIVDEINSAVKSYGFAENIISVDNIKLVDTEQAWNAELDCMRRLVAIDFASTNMNTVIDIYDDVKQNTILCDSILVSSAAIIIPDLPIISNYYDESLGITDWGLELDSILDAYKLLVDKGLANINNPIQTLDGEVIIACLNSKILKAAFIQEFNNNLNLLGLGAYYTMDEEKLAELDTPSKWDNELAAIEAVSDLVNNFSVTKVPTVTEQVESTIIAKAILVSFLTTIGI